VTGTANEFHDYNDKIYNGNISEVSSSFDLFSVWLFGKDEKVNAGCTLIDISSSGGAVLIPKKQPAPVESFDLVIMSPQDKNDILTILRAECCWVDEDYSVLHKKLGMRFMNINSIKLGVIDALIYLMTSYKKSAFKCCLLDGRK